MLPPNSFAQRAIAVSRVASVLVAFVALAALSGWLFYIPELTSLYLPGPTLKANAALCLICAAIANLALTFITQRSRWRLIASLLAAAPALALGSFTARR